MVSEEQLKGFIDGFKDALAAAGKRLAEHEKGHSVEDYGKLFQLESKQTGSFVPREKNHSEDYVKGYKTGYEESLGTVGQDLQDHEIEEYSVEDYGNLYRNLAEKMGNCALCNDIGSEKGCPVGKTIWCPRITETLDDTPGKD